MSKIKAREITLLDNLLPEEQLIKTSSYEEQNNWLIEIIRIAAHNYSFGDKALLYEQKIELLKNNPINGLPRFDLFWLADKFARVFGKVRYRCDYSYYNKYFFLLFFVRKPKSTLIISSGAKIIAKECTKKPYKDRILSNQFSLQVVAVLKMIF